MKIYYEIAFINKEGLWRFFNYSSEIIFKDEYYKTGIFKIENFKNDYNYSSLILPVLKFCIERKVKGFYSGENFNYFTEDDLKYHNLSNINWKLEIKEEEKNKEYRRNY